MDRRVNHLNCIKNDIQLLEKEIKAIRDEETGLPVYIRFSGTVEETDVRFINDCFRVNIKETVVKWLEQELRWKQCMLQALQGEKGDESQ